MNNRYVVKVHELKDLWMHVWRTLDANDDFINADMCIKEIDGLVERPIPKKKKALLYVIRAFLSSYRDAARASYAASAASFADAKRLRANPTERDTKKEAESNK